MSTKIEWVKNSDGSRGETWNPVTGCDKVSQGCKNCYAGNLAETRLKHLPEYKDGFYGNVQLHPDRLSKPLHWKKPKVIFVNSMSDLFHPNVPFEFIAAVFGVMAACPQHIFQILTKRPERAVEWFEWMSLQAKKLFPESPMLDCVNVCFNYLNPQISAKIAPNFWEWEDPVAWPLFNAWIGASIENQKEADRRIHFLLKCQAIIHFVSVEPLLSAIEFAEDDLGSYGMGITMGGEPFDSYTKGIDWIIVGGESGPNARPANPNWVRSIRDQCQEAKMPFFFKQWGEWGILSKYKYLLGVYDQIDKVEFDEQGIEYNHFITINTNRQKMVKVGKKVAGRLLDGREWNEMPMEKDSGNA